MATEKQPAYRRIVLKVSGEGLAGGGPDVISADALGRVAGEIAAAAKGGAQVAVVVGGGNMVRGHKLSKTMDLPEATAHQMGMVATVINALALQETLEKQGTPARTMSALHVVSVCEPYVRGRCLSHLQKGRVVIVAGGTGRPFVTTDTAAAILAAEVGADALLKATQVDGVYSADPKKDAKAKFYPKLSYDRVIDERLAFMDISAVDLCQRCGIRIVVFNLHEPGYLKRVVDGEPIGTVVAAD